jgi:hypothetical protein
MIKWFLLFLSINALVARAQTRFYISPTGKDTNPGTVTQPLASVTKALEKVKTAPQKTVQIFLRKGNYYLSRNCANQFRSD